MSRLTERTQVGIVGNNDRVKNYPLHAVAKSDPLDHGITGQCFERLAEYEDAEEQGLLLRLPCKVGDTIYLVDFEDRSYDEATVSSIEVDTRENRILINSDCEVGTYADDNYIFYSESEAEQALADKGV